MKHDKNINRTQDIMETEFNNKIFEIFAAQFLFVLTNIIFTLIKITKMLKAVMFLRMIALPFFINCHVRLNANANELLLIKKNFMLPRFYCIDLPCYWIIF